MNKIIKLLFILLFFESCATLDREVGNGIEETQTIELSSFNGISHDISHDLVVKKGDQYKVKLKGDSNILDNVSLEIRDDILYIDLVSGSYLNIDLKIEVTLKTLTFIENTGSGNIYVERRDDIRANLQLITDGSGNINVESQQGLEQVDIRIDGSGDMMFDGETSVSKVKITTDRSGNLHAYALMTPYCEIFADGGGDLYVTVSEELTGTIEGSGDIFYKGSPTIRMTTNGSGELIDKNN